MLYLSELIIVKSFIGENETLFGENLYGEHSIHYDKLSEYWHMFAINDSERWYSWDEVKEFAEMIGVKHVPELLRTKITSPEHIKDIINELMKSRSTYNTTRMEGIVMRLVNEFPINEFPHSVCKWVRPNHVQTDEHWTRNWKKAELIGNKY